MFFGVSKWFYLFIIVVSLIFLLFPQIDLMVSGFFYDGDAFYLKYMPINGFIYYYAPRSTLVFGLATIIIYLIMLIKKQAVFLSITRKGFLFLFLALAIGPGIVVNSIVKEFSGRARPAQIVQFGGDKTFTPPLVITDQCSSNCSFSSGHATVGFYFVALSLLFTGALATKLFWFGFLYGWLIGFVRIIQGGHFFSDVLFSFIFVYLSSKILYYFMFDRVTK